MHALIVLILYDKDQHEFCTLETCYQPADAPFVFAVLGAAA